MVQGILPRHFLGTFVAACILVGTVVVIEASDNYTVSFAANSNITAFSACKKVTNNSPTNRDVYIPTNSASEWLSFRTNPPTGVTLGSCGRGTPTTFIATGADQFYTVPSGVTSIFVQNWGASSRGNNGGYTHGFIEVTPGETLTVIVGKRGVYESAVSTYGGGGRGGTGSNRGDSGGGRSAVLRVATELITAGGGGGKGHKGYDGGLGGGTDGGGRTSTSGGCYYMSGVGGKAGGSSWTGGDAGGDVSNNNSFAGGGGGGGILGGGGGGAGGPTGNPCLFTPKGGGGGGGLSYCSPGVSDCLKLAGVNAGDGKSVITPYLPPAGIHMFSSTGADQFYTVPPGTAVIDVQLWGAGSPTASGGYTEANIAVTPGETLTIIAGGAGASGGGGGGAGGYGGGGRGGNPSGDGGGGRSAIRRGSTELVTAGGGGGEGARSGGGLQGAGSASSGNGGGGTQTTGGLADEAGATDGSAFQGGNGASGGGGKAGGGGGGGSGYYGGGGGGKYNDYGGGGSGYCGTGVSDCTTILGAGVGRTQGGVIVIIPR